MTTFAGTSSLGERWKIFLRGAASMQCNGLSMTAAAALIRMQWLSGGARRAHPDTVEMSRTLRIAQ